ncbi:glycolate permease glcA, partial [Salmonella enterica subsp. enterica serovar Panama]
MCIYLNLMILIKIIRGFISTLLLAIKILIS